MLFNSVSFAVFLPIIFIIYWIVPKKWQWFVILISSYYFYMCWEPQYVILIFVITAISYLMAWLIYKSSENLISKIYLFVGIAICLGILFVYKYYNFFVENLVGFSTIFGMSKPDFFISHLVIPVGISFYTFQAMSYMLDVYNRKINPETHFGKYAAYVAFFPQLVAGPIERTDHLLPQIKRGNVFDYDQAKCGIYLMVWGFYKKIVIADMIAFYVDKIYDNLHIYTGFALILASLMFTLQIYCDFSGYSDIAIGVAKLFGIDLMNNFKSPYFATSVKDFWRRWHISLSQWFRDYVYIPLGGSRRGKIRKYYNLFVTFLLSGLWHGASWTYVIWGGLHGVALILEDILRSTVGKAKWVGNKCIIIARRAIVFVFCNVAWVFFRAASLNDAKWIFSHSFDNIIEWKNYIITGFDNCGISRWRLGYMLSLILILIIHDFEERRCEGYSGGRYININWWTIVLMLVVVIFFSQKGVAAEFVYFQF